MRMDAPPAAPLWTSAAARAATGGACAAGLDRHRRLDRHPHAPPRRALRRADRRPRRPRLRRRGAGPGAAAALVSRVPEGVAADAPLLLVADVLDGLRALATAARERFRGRVVAVTGSVGKTGTKEMLRTALAAQGRVHAAEKSFNNHWGVPLTLARLPADADFAVLEIGMSAPGEIAPLARLARPHVAMITTVEAVHLAAFRDVRGIAREKAAIVEGLEPGGTAVLNRDTPTYPILLAAARRAGARAVRFGRTGRPEYRLGEVRLAEAGTCAEARAHGRRFLFRLGAPGRHLAMNALGVLAAVEALGGDLGLAAVALGRWAPPEGRGERWTVLLGPGGLDGAITLIDESYNANPAAMAAAFEVFAAAEPADGVGRVARGRRIAFLGDMLELGAEERALHAGLADCPGARASSPPSTAPASGCGRCTRRCRAPSRGEWFPTAADMAARVRRLLDPGDIAMVKGSRGARVDLVVEAIKAMGDARPAAAVEG